MGKRPDKTPNADVAVVIPTYNEAKNIEELVKRIGDSFKDDSATLLIIVVDDNSPDGTAEKAETLLNDYNLKVFNRKKDRGLATAVIHGWKNADNAKYLAVIDGDLQHPPDIIFRLYKAAIDKNADMIVASRKVDGGGTKNWESHRVFISSTATIIAKIFIPFTLSKIKDATTGCFLFENGNVNLDELSPLGFKIFLEVLARGKFKNQIEVPYIFDQRTLGESKMSLKQNLLFLVHLLKLGLKTGEAIIPITLALLSCYGVYLVFSYL